MGLLIFWFCLSESWLVAIQWGELVWRGAYQGGAPKSGYKISYVYRNL